jgi:hypothetical protein
MQRVAWEALREAGPNGKATVRFKCSQAFEYEGIGRRHNGEEATRENPLPARR